jgi:hypothetical protein
MLVRNVCAIDTRTCSGRHGMNDARPHVAKENDRLLVTIKLKGLKSLLTEHFYGPQYPTSIKLQFQAECDQRQLDGNVNTHRTCKQQAGRENHMK